MAGTVNKVILVGRLGKDPEVRSFQNGGKVVNMTLATSETWNDKASGERKEKTEWHNVVIRDERLAENAEKYLKKGASVYLEGKIETRKWVDQASGQDKFTTEIIIPKFGGVMTFLSGREDGAGASGGGASGGGASGGGASGGGASGGGGYQSRDRAAAPARSGGGGGAPSWEPAKGGDLDDEIPF